MSRPEDASAATLARVEAGAAAVLAGRPADGLARDLAALARTDPLRVTAEAHAAEEVALAGALGADAVRFDADRMFSPTTRGAPGGLCDLVRRCILVTDAHARALLLEALRATVAEHAAHLLATPLDVVVALGTQPARSRFPAAAHRAVDAAIALGLAPGRAAAAIDAMSGRAGRLGVRGARWLVADPELFAAIAGGWIDAATDRGVRRLGFVAPAVTCARDVAAIRRVVERAALEAGVAITVGAGIETAAGVLAIDAIEHAADFVELDLEVLTETCLALSRADAPRCLPQMLAAGLLPHDPFADLDFAIAALLTAAYREARARTARGCLGARALARLDDFAIDGVSVPAREVATVRIARFRRAAHATAAARAAELTAIAATAPRDVPPGPAPLPHGMRPHDLLDSIVAEVGRGLPPREALGRVPPAIIDALARPILDDAGREPLSVGLGVAPGAGVGRVALSPARAAELHRAGEPVILVVREVYGDEAAAVRFCRGLVSTRGGRTSHAALVAANAGIPCVIEESCRITETAATIGGRALADGDWLSIDGSTGAIHAGALPLAPGTAKAALDAVLGWADDTRRMRVLANADTPEAIAAAIATGAEGIGLVRSENMFLDHLPALHALLLGAGDASQLEALQTEAFAARLAAAQGRPITFRLLDASFYELLPHDRAGVERLAHALGMPVDELARRVDAERPIEPAMSLRASRLALARPALETAQVRALAAAYRAVRPEQPLRILVPMLVSGAEAAAVAARIRAHTGDLPLAIGAMIETPRAALDAAAIARAVDFFAWGSNDLTQYATGLARGLDDRDTLDLDGVGALIHIAETLARAAKPAIVTGVCGNLAADPRSIRAFHALGLDYISVPPAQLPRARLAAAQVT